MEKSQPYSYENSDLKNLYLSSYTTTYGSTYNNTRPIFTTNILIQIKLGNKIKYLIK